MKRDLDLTRKIVLEIESQPTGYILGDIQIDGYTEDQIGYHCYLLVDSGLAEGHDATTMGCKGPKYVVTHLTSAGHDFADAIRNETTWRKATDIATEKAGGVTLDILKGILESVIKASIGL